MSRKRFEAILQALTYTDRQPPTFIDKFWEVRQMLEAWGENMQQTFTPGYDRIPSTTPGAEPPRDAKDSGSTRSHSMHLETSSSGRP